ncbi:MAG: glycosyltransferase [Bacteroidia bacterium]|nr:glycosyltransferase [Bacteroidia bacterium]
MIPKIIHYCWFGGNPLPKDAQKCIASWKRYLPDYEIKRWDESNFDVRCCPYVSEAYDAKKYAFVSDYARFWVLYNEGGVYFDTDVEVIRDMSGIITEGCFMGFEKGLATSDMGVNPGLGLAMTPNHPILKELLDLYDNKPSFTFGEGTIVHYTTEVLKRYGLKNEDVIQDIGGITIYPTDYFCPMDSTTGIIRLTDNTLSIHHYSCSWMDHNTISWRLHEFKNWLIKVFGEKWVMWVCGRIK